MKLKKKYLAICCTLLISTETMSAINAYNEITPSPSDTGGNYNNSTNNSPYVKNNTIISPEINKIVGNNSYWVGGYIGYSTSNQVLDNIPTNNDPNSNYYYIYNLEGNDVGDGNIDIINSGKTAIGVLYKNYAAAVKISNLNGANAWVDSNDVTGADILNYNSKSYFFNNTATNAILNNAGKDGLMVFNGNSASGVNLTNEGIINAAYNIAQNATIKNNYGANILLYGNDFSNSTIENFGSLTLGDCSVSVGCKDGYTNISTMNNMKKFYNSGSAEMYISGGVNFDGSILDNDGTLELNNSKFLSTTGEINSNGIISLINNNTLNIKTLINNGFLKFTENQSNISTNHLNTLTINGDYTGQGGTIQINTKLGSDNSPTDFIQISGKATGSTNIIVNKLAGGTGAATVEGIHIIQTGNSETQAFKLDGDGYLSVGKYTYSLVLKKNETMANSNDTYDNWYLTTYNPNNIQVYSPNVGSYLASETMVNTLFTSRLEDREGASQYQNLGNQDTGNVWVRAYGGHHQFKSMQDQLKTTGNSVVTQIGSGLVSLGEEDQYNLGVMAGYADYNGKTKSNLVDISSKTKIDGYSLGLYGTWYAHPVEKRGAYIDSWVLWNKFKNKVDTADQDRYNYDSSGVTASLEVGGDYLLNKNGQQNWWIQPQSQVIYQGVHADNFQDAQNVDINHGKDNVQARLGVKTYVNIPTNKDTLISYRPYVALNFIHNTNPYSVVIDDVRYENEGASNLGELKLGVEGHITENSQIWLNGSYVAGSHNNQTFQGNIGWKYNF